MWAQRAALLRGDGDDNDRAQVLSDADVDALTQLYADQLRIDMHLLRNTSKGADGKDADVEGADSSDADVEDADSADSDGHGTATDSDGDDDDTADHDDRDDEYDSDEHGHDDTENDTENDAENDDANNAENDDANNAAAVTAPSSPPSLAQASASALVLLSDCAVHAPRKRGAAQSRYGMTARIANRLFAPSDGTPGSPEQQLWARIKYFQLIARLKRAYVAQQQQQQLLQHAELPPPVENASSHLWGRTCTLPRPAHHGPDAPATPSPDSQVHPDVLHPKAMPVDVAPPEDFADFFEFLRAPERAAAFINDAPPAPPAAVPSTTDAAADDPRGALEFQRGVFYTDGRMDLCKQVVGPRSIAALMDALRGNAYVRHFLLGNNIVDRAGAEAIAAYIAAPHANRIATWYIAGNAVDADGIARIAGALATDTDTTQLWLKRNPLKPAGADALAGMLRVNTTLVTLDLANTGLLDRGVAALFDALRANPASALRHLFLSANGLTVASGHTLSDYFSEAAAAAATTNGNAAPPLESLWIDVNHLGDAGLAALAVGLGAYVRSGRPLRRLGVGSNGATDAGVGAVLTALTGAPDLVFLNLGRSISTYVLGARGNNMGDATAAALVALIGTLPALQALDLTHHRFTPAALDSVLRAAASDQPGSLVYVATAASPGVRRAEPTIDRTAEKLAKAAFRARVRAAHNISYATFRMSAVHPAALRFVRNPPDVDVIDSVYRNAERNLRVRVRTGRLPKPAVAAPPPPTVPATRPPTLTWEAWRDALIH